MRCGLNYHFWWLHRKLGDLREVKCQRQRLVLVLYPKNNILIIVHWTLSEIQHRFGYLYTWTYSLCFYGYLQGGFQPLEVHHGYEHVRHLFLFRWSEGFYRCVFLHCEIFCPVETILVLVWLAIEGNWDLGVGWDKTWFWFYWHHLLTFFCSLIVRLIYLIFVFILFAEVYFEIDFIFCGLWTVIDQVELLSNLISEVHRP